MKTLIATAILAMAIASPALAQRARSAPQQGYQSQLACGNAQLVADTRLEWQSGPFK